MTSSNVTDPLTTARTLAVGRTLVGIVALLAPKKVGRLFLGSNIADAPAGTTVVRTIGGRDLALGLGLLVADRRKRPLRGWIEAGVLVDALDAVVAAFASRGVPFLSRVLLFFLAAGSATSGIIAANGLRDDDQPEAGLVVELPPLGLD